MVTGRAPHVALPENGISVRVSNFRGSNEGENICIGGERHETLFGIDSPEPP